MQMQSSHTRTVGLCFLACKPSSFRSIFQENSIFWIAILLFLSVTPYPLWFAIFHVMRGELFGCLNSFLSNADWLSLWIFVIVAIKKAEQARDFHFSAFICICVLKKLATCTCHVQYMYMTCT